ncbi:MAG TPA: polyprenyl synthetase family protein [Spirochaetales bacterium]|nr:polyprenyl synthetase family protein [Spirochaetales bacterium]
MLEHIVRTKPAIQAAVKERLAAYAAEYAAVSGDFGASTAARLDEFSSRGKMLRGCLVPFGYELAAGREPAGDDGRATILAGAAMELFQSGLLVHDDIMDRDRIRRGGPTVHAAYEAELERGRYADPGHNGQSLGICSGDVAFFAAFRILSELPVGAEAARRVVAIAARELSLVGVAQMQDVANGAIRPGSENPFRDAPCEPDEAGVLALYRYKTGRYTFSLPLALGAAIAGADEQTSQALERAGESLGVLFQLKDDELGLFADEDELGKPIGADVREDKKTLLRLYLFALASGDERARLESMFGNPSAGAAEIEYLRSMAIGLGARERLEAAMRRYAAVAETQAAIVRATTSSARAAFDELVRYSLERRS